MILLASHPINGIASRNSAAPHMARERMGLSREELAELLGISSLFMGYIENGQRGMSTETMVRVCLTLGISADYMLLGTPPPPESSDAQTILRDLPQQYHPLAAEVLRSLQKTIAVVRSEESLPPLPRKKTRE